MLKAVSPRERRHEFFEGVTDANGLWTVLFAKPFLARPHLSAGLDTADTETAYRIVALSGDGFSVHVFRRTSLNVLGINLLSFASANVAGQPCWAVAIEVY